MTHSPIRLLGAVALLAVAVAAGFIGLETVANDDGPTQLVDASSTTSTAAVVTTTTPATTATTTPPPPRTFSLLVSGDTIPHVPVTARARAIAADNLVDGDTYDYNPMFDLVRPRVEAADLAICHLETPLSVDGRVVEGYPTFSAPPELAEAIQGAGYDGCSAASNHSFDQGRQGVLDTVAVFDQLDLGVAGVADGEFRDATPTLYEVETDDGRTVTVAHISATYGLNGFSLPGDSPWLVDLIDPAAILEEAAEARRQGAEVVVVSLHWGVEYVVDPTSEQRAVAEAVLTSPDVDVVVGHHAHVVQTIERIGDETVVFGLGNFLSNQSSSCCPAATQDGVMVQLQLTDDGAGRFTVTDVGFTPTWVDRTTYTIVPVPDALADPATPDSQRSALQTSFDRTVEVLSRGGVVTEADVR